MIVLSGEVIELSIDELDVVNGGAISDLYFWAEQLANPVGMSHCPNDPPPAPCHPK
jgi:hypothetical protein